MTSKLWGLGAALACGAQILLLTGHGVGALLVSATLAWAVWQIWRYRGWLDTHVDMIILMCGYGGLGMMAGAPQCHNTAEAWFEMTAGMLIFGLVPVFFGSRCFAAARRAGDAIALLFFDTLGMAAGMAAMHVEMSFLSNTVPQYGWWGRRHGSNARGDEFRFGFPACETLCNGFRNGGGNDCRRSRQVPVFQALAQKGFEYQICK